MDPPTSSSAHPGANHQISRKPVNSPIIANSHPENTPHDAPQPPPANQSTPDSSLEKPPPALLPDADLESKKASPAPSVELGSITPYPYPYTYTKPSLKQRFQQRFDALLPPGKTYLRRFSRRAFLLILLAIMLLAVVVIALVLGLAINKRQGTADLPLPGDREIHTGHLTYYDVGLGACGETHGNGDKVCAVSHYVYDAVATSANPNENPLCGKKIRVRRKDERDGKWKSVDVTVVDRCEGCRPEDIDLSPDVFKSLADPDLGRVDGDWAWL